MQTILTITPEDYGIPRDKAIPHRYEDCKTREEREEHLQQVAECLKGWYSHIPFYAERAKNNPGYWRHLAASEVNACPVYSVTIAKTGQRE